MDSAIIQVQGLSVVREKISVLSDVNFTMQSGDFAYITGAVGSGKSTFLKVLYGDMNFEKGLVNVVGFDMSKITKEQVPFLRRKLGIIFQDYVMLSDRNIFDNLKFVLEIAGITSRKVVKDRVAAVLQKVNLEGKEYRMPYELSGGEQQRAAIARALLNEPLLIIADEPTGNLDDESSDNFMNILFDIAQSGASVLMATHDINLINKFPAQVYSLEKGSLFKIIP